MKKQNNSDSSAKRNSYSWIIKILLLTFVLSAVMSGVAQLTLYDVALPIAILLLLLFIFLGVFFDAIGVAVASASIPPFVSMTSKRVDGAKESLFLLKRAEVVANICNDVVGDICGIISGAAGSIIVLGLIDQFDVPRGILAILTSAIIASITVAGKALGKMIALKDDKKIVLAAGKVLFTFSKLTRKLTKRD